MSALSDAMEFDHVITVHADGTVTDGPAELYAPNLYGEEDKLETQDGQAWELCTHGYTGQYGYNGPVMHNSEYIGGRLARDIMARPGHYVAIACYWEGEQDMSDDVQAPYEIEGWAIAFLPSAETPA